MKTIAAALIAAAILYVVDSYYNDGRFTQVVEQAVTSVISRGAPHRKNPPVLAGGLSLFVCIIAETCQSQKRDCLKGIADWLTAGYRRSRRRWFLLAALFALAARCLG